MPAGLIPEPFAPDILPPDGLVMHSAPVFSPHGDEILFSAYASTEQPRLDSIYGIVRHESGWGKPIIASFSGEHNDNWPWYSPDGERIYFTSQRPLENGGESGEDGLWVVERQGANWSAPWPILAPSDFAHDEGPIYVAADLGDGFGDLDIYRLSFTGGAYAMPENLGPAVNSPIEEYAPWAGPEERYLLFVRYWEENGSGNTDIFVTFQEAGGTWTEAVPMGEQVDIFKDARFPALSPDGQYLFFIPAGGDAVYWVNSAFIDGLR
jgi:Tol biopolymer transport system component